MIDNDTQLAKPVIFSLSGLLGLSYILFESIPFFDGGTVFILGVSAVFVLFMLLGCMARLGNGESSWRETAVAIALIMLVPLSLLSLSAYNGTSDMLLLLSKYDITAHKVGATVVEGEIAKYPSDSPASLFLRRFLLSNPNATGIVWQQVRHRAMYLNTLYAAKLLPKNATVPYYGFLHSNPFVDERVLDAEAKRPDKKDMTYLEMHRKTGVVSHYINNIDHKVARVVLDGGGIITRYEMDAKCLAITNDDRMEMPVASLEMLPSIANQMGGKVNIPDIINLALGKSHSAVQLLAK